MAVSARTIINLSLRDLGVIAGDQSAENWMAQDALARLNNMVSGWRAQYGTVVCVIREVFDIVAGVGGPSNPYSVGPGYDIDIPRPVALNGAGLLLNPGETSEVELRLPVITDSMWQGVAVKNLSNGQPTYVYYNPTYPSGSLYLCPIPDVATNDLVLYYADAFSGFADLNTEYDWPDVPGYGEALQYQLDLRLATPNGREIPPLIHSMAMDTFGIIKRANNKLVDVPTDAQILTNRGSYGYNITSDGSN
jgi:hypothetical protein